MSERVCVTGCGRPCRDVELLCSPCQGHLTTQLAGVASVLGTAQATLDRRARLTAPSDGGRAQEQPLPIHIGMYEAKLHLEVVLVGWVRDLAERHGEEGNLPTSSMPSMASWLAQRMYRIATHPAADDIHDEICSALARVESLTDRPAERKFVGTCGVDDCPGWLYAKPNSKSVRCRECGQVHEVDEAMERVDKRLEDMLMTVKEIAGWARQFGIERRRAEKLLGVWLTRGKVLAVQHDQQGRAMLRYGPTMRLLRDTPTRGRGSGGGGGAELVAS